MQRLRSLRRKSRYTQLANDAIDRLPSLDAIGLLATILRHEDAFEFDMAVLIKRKPDLGKQRAYKARRALIEYGYLVQVRFKHTYRGQFGTDIYRAAEPHTPADLQELRQRYAPGQQIVITDDDGAELLATVTWAELTSANGVEKLQPGGASVRSSAASSVESSAKPQVTPNSGFPEVGQPEVGQPEVGNPESLKEDWPIENDLEPSFPPAPRTLGPNLNSEGRREGGIDLSDEDQVWSMLASIEVPAHKRAPGRRSAKLQAVAQRCREILAAKDRYGLTLEDLRRHLAADLESVEFSIVAVWSHRLMDDELPLRPRPAVTEMAKGSGDAVRLPACDVCRARAGDPAGVRTVRGDDGRVRRCDCHPSAKQSAEVA